MKLADSYDQLLSTILIGNNIVNIASASLATVLFVSWVGDAGVSASTVVMTVLVLIFGEVSPKSLAKEAPEKFAMFSAPIMKALIVVLTPVNYLFSQWKRLLSKVFRFQEDAGATEEELLTMVEEVQLNGGFDEQEGELIRSAIEFDDLRAEDILTPRVSVAAVSVAAKREEVAKVLKDTGFSRLPVYRGNIDHVIGFILAKDFYCYAQGQGWDLASLLKPVVFVTPSAKISGVLKQLQQRKSHIAVVSDEYGGTMGIVTLEDILEELVGEIWDEHDEVIPAFERVSETQYRVLCTEELEKLFDFFQIQDEEAEEATVNGWILSQLGHIPQAGEQFAFENLRITVSKADQKRVQEILVEIPLAMTVSA